MRIIGQIKNGVRWLCIYHVIGKDMQELAETQNILLCKLATAPEKEGKKMIAAIKKIDRILN
jgi:phosphoribosyl-dephospho-CoA transferase